MRERPVHVAFVAPTDWSDELLHGLSEPSQRHRVVERWFQWRDARLSSAIGPFIDRAAIARRVEGEGTWARAIELVREQVHLVAVSRLERALERFEQWRTLRAPEELLSAEREQIALALKQLPATAEWLPSRVPELHGQSGFLEAMVVAAQAEQTSFGAGPFDEEGSGSIDVDPLVPELIMTTSRLGSWLPERFRLARLVTVKGAWLRMEASGPVSLATRGDQGTGALDPTLASRLTALARDEVLVSFVWKDDSVAGPWEPVLRT